MSKLVQNTLAIAVFTALSQQAYAEQNTTNESAQDIEHIEVTGRLSYYSATKSNTPIMESARSISVETSEQFLEKGSLVLDDTLTYTAGVNSGTFGFASRGDWVSVRGLRVPQYQDSLQSLFGNYNNTRPDIYTLEQVEVLKGPASVLYGKGSPGGLLNVVSKRPQEEAKHEIYAELGNFSHKQLGFDSTGAIDQNEHWLYRAVGVYHDSGSQVDYVDEKRIVLAPSLTWRPNNDSELTLLVNYTKSKGDTAAQFLPIAGTLQPAPNGKKIPHNFYAGEPGFNKYEPETLAVTLIGEQALNDNWVASVTARYTDASADYQQAWISFRTSPDRFITLPDGSLYKDGLVPRTFYRKDATSKQKAIDVRLRGDLTLAGMDHEILAGVQYQNVDLGDAGYYAFGVGLLDPSTGQPAFPPNDTTWINPFNPEYGKIPDAVYQQLEQLYRKNPDSNAKDIGLYISDEISIDDWRITLGLRYDDTQTQSANVTQKDNELSLSAGILYQFDNGLSPYASYAESFDPVIGNNGSKTNPQPLKPQQGEQIEVGIKYELTAIPGFVTLAYFDIEQSNLSDPQALAGQIQQQQGIATIDGVEFEGFFDFNQLTVEVNAHKFKTKSNEGLHLASIPEKQASTWLNYRPEQLNGFKTALGVRYVGKNYNGADTLTTPSHTLVDVMLGYEYQQWDFTLNVRNLTDKTYYATCLFRGDCFPGEERSIVGRVSYAF